MTETGKAARGYILSAVACMLPLPVKPSACSEPAKRFAVCTHRSLSLSSSATSTSSSAVSSRNLEQFVCARVKSADGEVTWVLLSTELIENARTQSQTSRTEQHAGHACSPS